MAEREAPAEAESEEALEQASPTAVAMALGRTSRGGKAIDAEATAFLHDQRRLVNLQTEHLHEQRELQLAHLRVRRWRDRMSLALQALGVLIGIAVAAGLGVMVWQAHQDHGLVIEAFSVPPDLAARGMSGQVMASQMLDRLSALQAKTDSARPARSGSPRSSAPGRHAHRLDRPEHSPAPIRPRCDPHPPAHRPRP